MKKLFALVLTLALVFAIAAPAMAASWGDTDTTPAAASTPFGVVVSQTMATESLASDGITKIYDKYPSNLGVVAGTPVRFMVSYTVPKWAEVASYLNLGSATTLPAVTEGALTATLEVSNIDITSATPVASTGTVGGSAAIDAAKDEVTITGITATSADTAAKTYVFTFIGTIKETKKATIEASFGWVPKLPATGVVKKVGTVDYTIANTGTIGITTGAAATLKQLTFAVNGTKDNLVDNNKWVLTIGDVKYAVANKGTTFTVTDKGTSATLENGDVLDGAEDTGYGAVVAVYNELVGVLGFTQGDKVYFSDGNILAFFGLNKASTANAEYKPYTSSLTVTDGTNVPNTGDNMSVIGFVMVGLALLATAAVVVKKVRA